MAEDQQVVNAILIYPRVASRKILPDSAGSRPPGGISLSRNAPDISVIRDFPTDSEVRHASNMNHYSPPPSRHRVDWEDPDLKSLLDKTEGWGLDNRGVFEPMACEVHVGWGAGVTRPATLVFENSGVLVFEANFIIPRGENVRVDCVQEGGMRSRWGTVADSRAGRRADDEANGTQVYWLHVR